jgi:hypothetical protein
MSNEFNNETWADTVQRCIDGKWTKLAKNPRIDEPGCLLCKIAAQESEFMQSTCSACPIMRVSGRGGCINTPYDKWDELTDSGRYVLTEELQAAAWDEIAFLYDVKIYCIENDL